MEVLAPYLDQLQKVVQEAVKQAQPVIKEANSQITQLLQPVAPYYGQFVKVLSKNAAQLRPFTDQVVIGLAPVTTSVAYLQDQLPKLKGYPVNYVGIAVIVLHVLLYNMIAQLEYRTKIFTKIFGRKLAIYVNILFIIVSGSIRNHYLLAAIVKDAGSRVFLDAATAESTSFWLVAFGIFLNLWVLSVLGLKNMYNGDSFGFTLRAPITSGPFKWFDDPQYFGTTCLLLGYAIRHQSRIGYGLTGVMYLAYSFSVMFIEGPHMRAIYENLSAKKNKTPSKKQKTNESKKEN